jgi:hypothetical protein
MKIANQYENCKAIITFWCMVPTWTFAIFIWETQRDWKLVPEMNFSVGLRRGWQKTHREQSLAKPSTIHILILIPVQRQSDSYFMRWFLRSLKPYTPSLLPAKGIVSCSVGLWWGVVMQGESSWTKLTRWRQQLWWWSEQSHDVLGHDVVTPRGQEWGWQALKWWQNFCQQLGRMQRGKQFFNSSVDQYSCAAVLVTHTAH